jgi:hypothetical protein
MNFMKYESYQDKRNHQLDMTYASASIGIALVYGSDFAQTVSPVGAGIAKVAGIGSLLYAFNKVYHMAKGDF